MSSEDESGILMEVLNPRRDHERIYMERELDEKYKKVKPREDGSSWAIRKIRSHCMCSGERFRNAIFSIFPIFYWLPRYDIRKNLVGDVAAGLTVGIVQIPQGMAYALLANLPPIVGMYVSFFPVIIYPIFGTSRHLSIGTFAVVSILVSDILAQRVPESYCEDRGDTKSTPLEEWSYDVITGSGENGTTMTSSNADCRALYEQRKIEVAIALSIGVGLWQVIMSLFQLGIVTVFLSESLLSGFVSGASIHVITSQIPKFFGIVVPRRSGLLSVIYVYIDVFKNITSINWGTFIISLVSTAFLVAGKEINNRYRKKLPMPVPWELGVVIFSTLASHYGKFEQVHEVVVVGDIPTGISTTIPRISDISMVLVDSITLAVVIFTVEISLCKMFATKHAYEIDSNQELLALGACNIFGSFFSCFPSASSLSRSVIYEEIGGKTQLGGYMSSAIVLGVLLWIGPLFEPLPQAALAVIIIVNIKRLVLMWKNVPPLWKISRLDAITWIVAWFAVVIFGVGSGLMIGVSFSLLGVLIRTRGVKGNLVQPIAHSDAFRDPDKYDTLSLPDKILIFRFTGPLYFGNKDKFVDQFVECLGFDPVKECARRNVFDIEKESEKKNKDGNSSPVTLTPEENNTIQTPVSSATHTHSKVTPTRNDADSMSLSSDENEMLTSSPCRDIRLRKGGVTKSHVIVDMGLCSFMDSDGAKVIRGLYDSLTSLNVRLMLASCSEDVKTCLRSLWKDRESIEYLTVKSAVEWATVDTVRGVSGIVVEIDEDLP